MEQMPGVLLGIKRWHWCLLDQNRTKVTPLSTTAHMVVLTLNSWQLSHNCLHSVTKIIVMFLMLLHFLHQKTSILNPAIMSLPGLRSELPHTGWKCFWQGEGGESILAAGAATHWQGWKIRMAVLGQTPTANCAHDVTVESGSLCTLPISTQKSVLFMRNPQWNLARSTPVSGMGSPSRWLNHWTVGQLDCHNLWKWQWLQVGSGFGCMHIILEVIEQEMPEIVHGSYKIGT